MKTLPLGKSGISVAPLAFGGNVFGWTIDQAMSFRLLDAFVDAGFNLVDTANMYSTWVPGHVGGESESMIGDWLRASGKRQKVVLATKVGLPMGDGSKGLTEANIMKSVEDSLRRLKTDYIDLYQSHEDDESTPLEETLRTYDQLIRQGKVRAIGASNYMAGRLQEALETSDRLGLARYTTLQPEYNLCERRGFEEALQPLCEREGVGVVPYYSLASGFLTGKYRTEADLGQSVRGEGAGKYLNERGLRILSALDAVSEETGAALATVSLAWLMHRPAVVAPIASATRPEQLTDLIAAPALDLTPEQIARLDEASTD